MRLAELLTFRFALGAMSAWSGKTRRAPSRHCRGARVYGHTTTVMHDQMSTLKTAKTRTTLKAVFTVVSDL